MRDITYCLNPDCPFDDCERHYEKAPKGEVVSVAHLYRTCRPYIGWLVDEVKEAKDG